MLIILLNHLIAVIIFHSDHFSWKFKNQSFYCFSAWLCKFEHIDVWPSYTFLCKENTIFKALHSILWLHFSMICHPASATTRKRSNVDWVPELDHQSHFSLAEIFLRNDINTPDFVSRVHGKRAYIFLFNWINAQRENNIATFNYKDVLLNIELFVELYVFPRINENHDQLHLILYSISNQYYNLLTIISFFEIALHKRNKLPVL